MHELNDKHELHDMHELYVMHERHDMHRQDVQACSSQAPSQIPYIPSRKKEKNRNTKKVLTVGKY